MLIAVEGIDGSGKGTQSRLLGAWIKEKGYDIFLTKEPTEGAIGKLLREALKQRSLEPRTEALLFAADRSEHVKEISANLKENKIVITERYFYSSVAYQGAAGVSIAWLKEINRFAIIPEVVLFLDVMPELGLKRVSFRNSSERRATEYFEKEEFLSKVREIYLDLEKENKNFVRIDASGSVDEVQAEIRKRIGKPLATMEEKKVPRQKKLGEFLG